MKVLLVDDEEDLRVLVGKLLRHAFPRIEVMGAQNGSEGFATALREQPDVVITDGQMPGMTGSEMIAALRASGHVQTIISLTGVPQTGQQAIVAGADAALEKMDFKRLPALIRGLVFRSPAAACPGVASGA